VELYLHSPNTPSWRGAQLKHRDNFTFGMVNVSENNAKLIFGPRRKEVAGG
jgi:hypothetical protein